MPAGLLFHHVGPNEGSRLPAGLLFPPELARTRGRDCPPVCSSPPRWSKRRIMSTIGMTPPWVHYVPVAEDSRDPSGVSMSAGRTHALPVVAEIISENGGSELMRHTATPEGVRGAVPARFGGARSRDRRCAPTSLGEGNPDEFRGLWHEVGISMQCVEEATHARKESRRQAQKNISFVPSPLIRSKKMLSLCIMASKQERVHCNNYIFSTVNDLLTVLIRVA